MKKINRLLLLSIVFIVLIFGSFSTKATDFENWTFVGGGTKIGNMQFFFHSANFFRQGSDYFLNHTQMTLGFPSKNNFSFGIAYKQEYVEFSTQTNWRAEYRPMLHLFYTKKWVFFELSDRSRWEFRFFDGELINRYRNQVQVAFTKLKRITPYLSTEFSFYFNQLDYTRQRTIFGAEIPIKSLSLNLFLGHQINEDLPGIWTNKIMLGTGLSYGF
jgi:hypothetical protein